MSVIIIREKQSTATGFTADLIFDGSGGEYQIQISDPFTSEQELLLEWYYEEWLTYPMLEGRKAEAAKTSVVSYGEELFDQVFKADINAYIYYCQLRSNLNNVKIEIVGNSPEFHALHWEAIRDKDLPRPLAVDCVILRKLIQKAAPVAAQMTPSPVINLLIVIARPDEEDDIGYRTISRPLIEMIENSRLPVKVDLLRPGTYENLERHLEEKGAGYYHIIHFDCNGSLMAYADIEAGVRKNKYAYQARWGREDIQPYEGIKAFLFLEGESKGKADLVEAGELANLLTGKGIPVCILNACQSGKQVKNEVEIEHNRETSLGSRLMTAGMQMVVAMGYSVTVSAAQLMMEKVYQNLFAGKEITEAIRLGRRELFNNKVRKEYFHTNISLEDWLLPVVYSNQQVNLNLRKLTFEESEQYYQQMGELYQYTPPEYGFIGRDLEILKIEKALLRHNVLLLQGMGGAGKTALLNYLRSWWQKTNFVAEIFYFGYDKKAWTLTQILLEIGQKVYNKFKFANFQTINVTIQTQQLLAKLRSSKYILILDNLESITGQDLAIQNTLPEVEQKQLQAFLTKLVGGETRVILSSRSEESWLKAAFKQNIYKLQGLDNEARTELSNNILERNINDERKIAKVREDENFQKLMKILAGYPLAMEVVLADLKNLSSQEILAKLEAGDINLDTGSENKTQSILSADAQKLLLCLTAEQQYQKTQVKDTPLQPDLGKEKEKSLNVSKTANQKKLRFNLKKQHWYVSELPKPHVVDKEIWEPLRKEIDIVIITATDTELEAVRHLLKAYPNKGNVLLVYSNDETYYLGQFGEYKTVVTQCAMGAIGRDAAINATRTAIDLWLPKAIIMVGIAFGKDPAKQKIGDVLVASEIIPYEPVTVGKEGKRTRRASIPPSNKTLLNRFRNTPDWRFTLPNKSLSTSYCVPILSGEKLFKNQESRDELFEEYPEAMGGDMEGAGLYAAASSQNVAWILVKSICDWGDEAKNDDYQALAAAAATSLVHYVLSQKTVLNELDYKKSTF